MKYPEKFSKILVATDGSRVSTMAANVALRMAKRNGSKLVIVTVLDVPYGEFYMSEIGNYSKYAERRARDEATKWCEEIKQKAKDSGIKAETAVILPTPNTVGAIVNYADHNDVDLIVIGSTGRTGFKRLLLGSVATGVVTYATCPVMVIK